MIWNELLNFLYFYKKCSGNIATIALKKPKAIRDSLRRVELTEIEIENEYY